MEEIVLNISVTGAVRAVYSDDYPFLDVHGCNAPKRASHVEAIQTGPNRGLWFADMTPLGEEYQYCLWPPCSHRVDALAAERAVVERWCRSGKN